MNAKRIAASLVTAIAIATATAMADGSNAVTVTILSPVNGVVVTADHVRVHGTADSPAGIALVFVNGEPVCGTTNWCAMVDVCPGSNVITAVAVDNDHRHGMARLVIFGAGGPPPQDRIPPVITDVAPPSGVTTNDAVALMITALDNVAVATVKVNGQAALALGSNVWSFAAPLRTGENKFDIIALDAAGNYDRELAVYFRTATGTNDTLPPTITAVEPPGGTVYDDDVDMLITVIDNVGVTGVKVNGQLATARGADQWQFHAHLRPGDNQMQIAAIDAAGNVGRAVVVYTLASSNGTDTLPPVITAITPPSGVVTNREVDMLIAAEDNVGVTRVQVEDKPAVLVASNLWAYRAVLVPGQNWLHVFAFDAAGNVGRAGVTYLLGQGSTNDCFPPRIVKIEPPCGVSSTNTVDMLITAVDNIGVTAVEVNHALATLLNSTQWTYRATLQPGPNAFHVDAFDAAGNIGRGGVGYWYGVPGSNDVRRPVIVDVQPHSGPTTNDAVNMLITAVDDVGVVSVTVNSNSATQVASNRWAYHAPLALGQNNFMIVARDAAGLAAMTRVGYLRVTALCTNMPPRILDIRPGSGPVTNNPLTMLIKAVDNVGITSLTVNGNEAQARGSDMYSYTLALVSGTNPAIVVASDGDGNAHTARVVYVYRNSDPATAILSISTTSDELDGYLNKPYAKLLEAEGGDGTYFWTVNGLKPNLVSTPDGEITGIPIVPGQHSVALEVSSAGQTFTTNLLMTILDEPADATIINDKVADGIAQRPYAAAFTLAGAPDAQTWQFAALDGLPTGLILQPDGRLLGQPVAAGSYAVRVRATQGAYDVTKTIALNVVPPAAGDLGQVSLEAISMKCDWQSRDRGLLRDRATARLSFTLPAGADPLQQQWVVKLGNYPVPLENPVQKANGSLITFANRPADAGSLAISAKARVNAQGRVRLTVQVRNADLGNAFGLQNQTMRRGSNCLPTTMKVGAAAGHDVLMLRQDGVAGRAMHLRTAR
jgi:hypothetical protein